VVGWVVVGGGGGGGWWGGGASLTAVASDQCFVVLFSTFCPTFRTLPTVKLETYPLECVPYMCPGRSCINVATFGRVGICPLPYYEGGKLNAPGYSSEIKKRRKSLYH